MRIGFDAKRAYNNSSGLGNYSRYIINGLARFYPENTYHLYTPSEISAIDYRPPAGSVVHNPHGLSRIFRSYWRSVSLGKQLEYHGVDLYHGLSNELPLQIGRSAVKSVVTIHDLIFLSLPELYKPIDRNVYRKKTASAILSADRIIAISSQTRDDLVNMLGADESKIRVIFQGCHPWFYESLGKDALKNARDRFGLPEQYLLYVGTIEKRKNLLEIIRAMHLGGIDMPLVAVGRKTDYYKEVKEYIEKHDLGNILFRNFVPSADLPAFYQGASAFIYPSSYEGFGIPVLEALNSGVPVITSRGGCLEETAGPAGLLVDPMDTEELSDAIQRSLSDSNLRHSMVNEGKKHAMKFREENTIPALYEVYKECIN